MHVLKTESISTISLNACPKILNFDGDNVYREAVVASWIGRDCFRAAPAKVAQEEAASSNLIIIIITNISIINITIIIISLFSFLPFRLVVFCPSSFHRSLLQSHQQQHPCKTHSCAKTHFTMQTSSSFFIQWSVRFLGTPPDRLLHSSWQCIISIRNSDRWSLGEVLSQSTLQC